MTKNSVTKVEIKWSQNEAIDCFAGVYGRLVDASAAISVALGIKREPIAGVYGRLVKASAALSIALGIKNEPIAYGLCQLTAIEVTFSDGFVFEGRFDVARRLAENRPLFPITVAT